MASEIDRYPASIRALAVFPLASLTDALCVAGSIPVREIISLFPHEAGMARFAAEHRAEHLAVFAAADDAHRALREASDAPLTRPVATQMLAAMLDTFGAKTDKGLLVGMVEVLESDDIARGSKLWQPLDASPAALALACRTLVATTKFTPKPAELHTACRDAISVLRKAEDASGRLVGFIQRCDAILLEFAFERWRGPYGTPTFAPILPRMLDLHDTYGTGNGDRSDAFDAALDRARGRGGRADRAGEAVIDARARRSALSALSARRARDGGRAAARAQHLARRDPRPPVARPGKGGRPRAARDGASEAADRGAARIGPGHGRHADERGGPGGRGSGAGRFHHALDREIKNTVRVTVGGPAAGLSSIA